MSFQILHDLCMFNLAGLDCKVMKYEYACILTQMMADLLGTSDRLGTECVPVLYSPECGYYGIRGVTDQPSVKHEDSE